MMLIALAYIGYKVIYTARLITSKTHAFKKNKTQNIRTQTIQQCRNFDLSKIWLRFMNYVEN